MLGVLGARYIVAPPIDLMPRAGGYMPIGPMVDGRTVTSAAMGWTAGHVPTV